MAKTILGVDIGHDQLKLALVRDGQVLNTALASMPERLMKDGRVTSRETMSDLIRETMKAHRIRANRAAFVLPNEAVYVKNVKLPAMTADQLLYNLPFEFSDYITGEIRDYVFDYAMLDSEEPEKGTMELMAAGTPRSVLEDVSAILRGAGLKLAIAAPALCSYMELIRRQKAVLEKGIPSEETDVPEGTAREYCILDLGCEAVRMYMFRGERHIATRVLETGLSAVDRVLADLYGVEIHLAHTYLVNNFENCQDREECRAVYENIAVELMRALNFYRFSNPDSRLADMWVCGGGAAIRPLSETIEGMLDIRLHPASELVAGGDKVEACNTFVQAIGITFS